MNLRNGDLLLFDLVDRIYGAALDPSLWDELLEDVTAVFDASALGFYVADGPDNRVGFLKTTGLTDDQLDAYVEHYAATNVWYQRAYRLRIPACMATLSQDFFPERELMRSEFYADFLKYAGIHHNCGGPIRYDGSEMSVFNVMRPRSAGPFDADHATLCQALMPHFARAVQIHREFASLQERHDAALDILDALPMAVLILDHAGRVAFMNMSAGRIIAEGDGLAVDRGGRPRAALTAETTALRRQISDATGTGDLGGLGAGGGLSLTRRSGRRPLAVLVTPLRDNPFGRSTGPLRAVLFVSDPDRRHEPPTELLARLYGLTPSEARLAVALMAGGRLQDMADSMGITRNTAQTHLKSIFRKTETRRQSELVRLLLSGPASLDI